MMVSVCSTLFLLAFANAVADLPLESASTDEVSLLQHSIDMNTMKSSTNSTPLTKFRDAVVRRPTPPMNVIPQPEIVEMRLKAFQTPLLQATMCGALDVKLKLAPMLQEPLYLQGAHLQAMEAMKNFADNAAVQASCSVLMGDMVQWNWVLARALADDGAMDAILAGMRRFPENPLLRQMTSILGSFCDFDIQNKRKLGEMGLVDHVYTVTDAHYTSNDVAGMYNLWSTLCNLPELAEQMVEGHNELERGVRAMKTLRTGTTRGEVIQVHGSCFTNRAEWLERTVKAGIIPEIVSAMSDEMSGVDGELDTVGKPRLLWNALSWLKTLATVGPQARTEMVDAGAVGVIVDAMRDGNAQGHGFQEMQHDVSGEACNALAAIMVDGTGLARLHEEFPELQTACSNLRGPPQR